MDGWADLGRLYKQRDPDRDQSAPVNCNHCPSKIPNDRCLLGRIINALMVDGRRFGSAVSFVVTHDEVSADCAYSSRLRVDAILYWCDGGGILFRGIPENEDGRNPFQRAQYRPIGLSRFRKSTFDDIVASS